MSTFTTYYVIFVWLFFSSFLFLELLWRSLEQFWFLHCPGQLDRYYHGWTERKSKDSSVLLTISLSLSLSSSLLYFSQLSYLSSHHVFWLSEYFPKRFFDTHVQNYFRDPWNVFDFVIVLGSFTDIVYSEISVSISPVDMIPLSHNITNTFTVVSRK